MLTISEFAALSGQDLGHSDWLTVDQARVDAFADVTEDHQFIHVDPEAAAKTPLGGTIAHGFLTLSLLSHLNAQVFPPIANRVMTFNYGLDRVRFLNPVAVGARVRSQVMLQGVEEKQPSRHLCRFQSRIEIEGIETPALIAEQLMMHVIGAPDGR
ncbi:MAG: MaoC family dehydratase [Paracoccaceae bacterium]